MAIIKQKWLVNVNENHSINNHIWPWWSGGNFHHYCITPSVPSWELCLSLTKAFRVTSPFVMTLVLTNGIREVKKKPKKQKQKTFWWIKSNLPQTPPPPAPP